MQENEVSAAAGFLTLAIWIYLLLGRGSFWRLKNCALRKGVAHPSPASPIAVVVPARNEAAVIGRSLESLLQQSYGGAMMNWQCLSPLAMHCTSAATSGMAKLSSHQPEEYPAFMMQTG